MIVCKEVLTVIHYMLHELIEKGNVCLESGHIKLPDTEPDMSLIVIVAAVETEHFDKIRMIGHSAITQAMEEIYGASNETSKQ